MPSVGCNSANNIRLAALTQARTPGRFKSTKYGARRRGSSRSSPEQLFGNSPYATARKFCTLHPAFASPPRCQSCSIRSSETAVHSAFTARARHRARHASPGRHSTGVVSSNVRHPLAPASAASGFAVVAVAKFRAPAPSSPQTSTPQDSRNRRAVHKVTQSNRF